MAVDDGWKALAQVNEWIRFADAKAAVTLAASGLLGGLLVKQIPQLGDFRHQPAFATLLTLAIIFDGCAALITLRTLAPRLRTGEPRSLIYFDHVAKRYSTDAGAFVDNLIQLIGDERRFLRHMAEQVWANSRVARRKFRRVSIAIYFLGGAMAASGAAVIVQRLGILQG